MNKAGYYSSGKFAKMAHITLRTIRFYDKKNLLKPSYVSESGARFYTDQDFLKLQQILLLKYLGFSLDDIKTMIIDETDHHFMQNSLEMQLHLVQDRIEQLRLVEKAIQDTTMALDTDQEVDWSQMLHLIHLTNMEKSLKLQYQNASNISARIKLHHLYSKNQQGWFPWIYEQCNLKPNMNVLELGCGDGSLWLTNKELLPDSLHIHLSDLSEGMLRDARRAIGTSDPRFSYQAIDAAKIPLESDSFDLVIANHVLFYCDDLKQVCSEIQRVLKPNGVFLCSTYGKKHMKEITDLVQEYDSRILLSAENLYDRFGLYNGADLLTDYFSNVRRTDYEDSLFVTDPEPLIAYILSCHGNQNQFLLDHYKEFKDFVKGKMRYGFHITKEAGIFLCNKCEESSIS